MKEPFVNLTDYTLPQILFFGAGCFLWIVVYFDTIRTIIQRQFVEIPLVTVCGNIAWEFLWSWIFLTNMGSLFVWGYRIWFFMDCFIVYGIIRYGYKQLSIPYLQKKSVLIIICSIVFWFVLLYYYIKIYDAPISKMGAYSGYILNLLISGLYIPQFLRLHNTYYFSATSAWAKRLGTILISVFCFLHFNDPFLLSLCIATAILDTVYVYIFTKAKPVDGNSFVTNNAAHLV